MRIAPAAMAVLSMAMLLSACGAGPSAVTTQKADKTAREERCYQEFAALRKLDPAAYELYRQQFQTINDGYGVYKDNEPLVDGSSSEVMLTEINKALSLVCVRIKNAVYSNMMNRVDALSTL
ncbi:MULTISPECIES: hypothetical protein [Bordetella]|uniref:hypothetical protein n=1 Tax=Bordetella TaxID=517 RepID=UPI001140656B|nr:MULTISPECIES: hypothetical protein [Bordetella]